MLEERKIEESTVDSQPKQAIIISICEWLMCGCAVLAWQWDGPMSFNGRADEHQTPPILFELNLNELPWHMDMDIYTH